METPTLSDAQITRLWENMLFSDMRANYFAELAGRYHARQRVATWATLVLSSGAAALCVSSLPAHLEWLKPTCALMAAAISMYSLVAQNQKAAIDCANLHDGWNRLNSEYRDLWENTYSDDAQTLLRQLEDKGHGLSKLAMGFPNDQKSLLKWQDHANKQYAAA